MWGYQTAMLLPDGDILLEAFDNNPDYVELPVRAPYGQRVFVDAEEYRRKLRDSLKDWQYSLAPVGRCRCSMEYREFSTIAFTGEYCDQ